VKNQCLQDERVDCSSNSMRAFVWDFEGSQRVPLTSTFGSTFGKEEIGVRFPPLVSFLLQVLLMKDQV
jgi:hypothetical protein